MYAFIPADTAAEDALNTADNILAFITGMADNITGRDMTLSRDALGGLCTVIDGVRSIIQGAAASCRDRYQDGFNDGREAAVANAPARRAKRRPDASGPDATAEAEEVAAVLEEAFKHAENRRTGAPKLTEEIPPDERGDTPDEARDDGRATA